MNKILFIGLFLLMGLSVNAQETDKKATGYITQSKVKAPENAVFEVVDKMPTFPGGMGMLMRFLSSHIHYPAIAEKNGIQGRVICRFVIEKDGSVTDVKVVKSVAPSLDQEAVRVISSMPKWNPGSQKGVPVRVNYTLPINFSLDSNKAKEASLLWQLMAFHEKLVTNRVEKGDNNNYELNYYNDDCIDYTLVRGTDRTYTLHEGKNTLFDISQRSQMIDSSKKGQNIRIYPGKFVNEKKLESIVYAMPVMNGKKTQCKAETKYYGKDSVAISCFYFMMNPDDTICAMRSGVVCPDVVNNRLFIYHEDGTIALYTNIQKLVKHTDRIIAGQPIGKILKGKHSTRVSIIYLTPQYLKNTADIQFPYTSYSPLFRTTKGDVSFEGTTILTPNTDDALRMQEMTSKEKKALLKK